MDVKNTRSCLLKKYITIITLNYLENMVAYNKTYINVHMNNL